MLSRWPIRVKLLIGLALLLLLLLILAGGGLYATYAYRGLAKGLSARVEELPAAAEVSRQVTDLRIMLGELAGLRQTQLPSTDPADLQVKIWKLGHRFASGLDDVDAALAEYRLHLENTVAGSPITDNHEEWETLRKVESALARVHQANEDSEWMMDDIKIQQLDHEVQRLQHLVAELPEHLHRRMRRLAADVRGQYRGFIVGTWIVSLSAGLILALFVRLFYRWVFVPLRLLIAGSREVAAGNFGHRITLATDDEMAELADAMNRMTDRFEATRDDLDRQVQERTRQVVRNEQLASVGFLAAGVAHEINNPLASIAMSAESLEERVAEILDPADARHEVVASYLTMIQSEAFRCKEITERLLDFSRTGEVRRQNTDLAELVRGVIDMVKHLGRYQGKRFDLSATGPVVAWVNAQEIKQVVLNLLTNALDSIDATGHVRIELARRDGMAQIDFTDDGCGMAPDVLDHVFEPFYTRKRNGQGTGLGLSITARIVADHGGEIVARSDGPKRGATFQVRLPLRAAAEEVPHRDQAA